MWTGGGGGGSGSVAVAAEVGCAGSGGRGRTGTSPLDARGRRSAVEWRDSRESCPNPADCREQLLGLHVFRHPSTTSLPEYGILSTVHIHIHVNFESTEIALSLMRSSLYRSMHISSHPQLHIDILEDRTRIGGPRCRALASIRATTKSRDGSSHRALPCIPPELCTSRAINFIFDCRTSSPTTTNINININTSPPLTLPGKSLTLSNSAFSSLLEG